MYRRDRALPDRDDLGGGPRVFGSKRRKLAKGLAHGGVKGKAGGAVGNNSPLTTQARATANGGTQVTALTVGAKGL